ncbi:MAG TPA: ankyrin repeat domain-containing protein [Gemmataceae bacterium]|nr:ankyrin repeat domain-containing protein [Gemmataceae bacterium]
MSNSISRRAFTSLSAGFVLGSATALVGNEQASADPVKPPTGPVESPFERDYPPPEFKPSWKKQQINRLLVQDFVIYAHSDLAMTKKLLEREPALLNATMDWGHGDWETGLGGASHMGRRDIVGFLLERGARIDLFCAAMMGQLEAVRSLLTLQPKLIDAKGPHGFTLHFHAQVGGSEAEPVLAYLQSIKKVELKPNPFLKKSADAGNQKQK